MSAWAHSRKFHEQYKNILRTALYYPFTKYFPLTNESTKNIETIHLFFQRGEKITTLTRCFGIDNRYGILHNVQLLSLAGIYLCKDNM